MNRFCKEFGFTAGILRDALADGRKKIRRCGFYNGGKFTGE